jgi:protein involved in polysaccharide export with SLBB domain
MKSKKNISTIFVFIFLFSASFCEVTGQGVDNAKPVDKNSAAIERKSEQSEIVKNENIATQKNNDLTVGSNTNKTANNDRYRIGYQDTVEVNVIRHPELSQSVQVSPEGEIFLPRINSPIAAVCKTEGELKNEITQLYKKNLLRDPFVTVRVVNQMSQSFGVVGAVHKPGTFYLSRPVRLFELLTLAGGEDVEFAGGKIQLARLGNVTGCKETNESVNENENPVFISYKLKDVREGRQNPWMQPGDIISVLKSEEAYVIGNVLKPATVQLDEPKTLTQALAIAGGIDGTANTEKVVIQRQASENSPKMDLVFDLKDIKNKKIPDPQLQANDIIAVGNDKVKSIGKGLVKAISGGVGNLFYRIP